MGAVENMLPSQQPSSLATQLFVVSEEFRFVDDIAKGEWTAVGRFEMLVTIQGTLYK